MYTLGWSGVPSDRNTEFRKTAFSLVTFSPRDAILLNLYVHIIILYGQYHGCCCSGDARHQVIRNHAMERFPGIIQSQHKVFEFQGTYTCGFLRTCSCPDCEKVSCCIAFPMKCAKNFVLIKLSSLGGRLWSIYPYSSRLLHCLRQ